MNRRLFILGLAFLLGGCGLLPDIRLKREVTKEEIVGLWVLENKSLEAAKKAHFGPYQYEGIREHTIEIRPDGTCRFQSLTQMPTEYSEAEGKWKLAKASDDPKSPELALSIEKDGIRHFSLDFKEANGHLILWQFLGDPDNWEFLEYRKKPTPPAQPISQRDTAHR